MDDFSPDLIAITVMTNDFQHLETFWPKIRVPKHTKIIVGGVHAMFATEEILKTGFFDLVCTGQGEEVFSEVLENIEKNAPMDSIDGTIFYDKITKKTKENRLRMLLSGGDLWRFPVDYEEFDHRYYIQPFDGRVVNYLLLEVGRGCPYNCSYCSAPVIRERFKGLGKYFTTRPIESIFNFIKKVNELQKIDVYNITHENFLMQKRDFLEEFVDRWAKEVRKPFFIQTRAETINEENLLLLKKSQAPVIQIGLGIESGSKRILDLCNKKTQHQEIINAYRLMSKHGIRTNAFYMIGFPSETRKDIFDTIELCRQVKSDINVISTFQPFPGLPLTKYAIEKGYMTGKERIPAYTGFSIIKNSEMTSQEIENLRNTFILYAKLPKELYPDIEKCEKNPKENQKLFDKLLSIRWEENK